MEKKFRWGAVTRAQIMKTPKIAVNPKIIQNWTWDTIYIEKYILYIRNVIKYLVKPYTYRVLLIFLEKMAENNKNQ